MRLGVTICTHPGAEASTCGGCGFGFFLHTSTGCIPFLSLYAAEHENPVFCLHLVTNLRIYQALSQVSSQAAGLDSLLFTMGVLGLRVALLRCGAALLLGIAAGSVVDGGGRDPEKKNGRRNGHWKTLRACSYSSHGLHLIAMASTW